MMFAGLELSRRLERAEGNAGREFAEARRVLSPGSGAGSAEFGGAWAIFDGAESPVTQSFGLGLFEESTPEILDRIEHFFADREAPVLHEVSPFAGIATLDLLCERGYRPVELSSVMHRSVQPDAAKTFTGIEVRVAGVEDAILWAEISARGWASEYPELQESIREFGRLGFGRLQSVCFLAEFEGQAGAAAALCLHEGVALFAGAATVPEVRRRGLQTALLRARMDYALAHGCDLAMMVTAVGSQSQRNAERAGFRIAYTRTKWQMRSVDRS